MLKHTDFSVQLRFGKLMLNYIRKCIYQNAALHCAAWANVQQRSYNNELLLQRERANVNKQQTKPDWTWTKLKATSQKTNSWKAFWFKLHVKTKESLDYKLQKRLTVVYLRMWTNCVLRPLWKKWNSAEWIMKIGSQLCPYDIKNK